MEEIFAIFANLDFARSFPPAKIISTANGISRNFTFREIFFPRNYSVIQYAVSVSGMRYALSGNNGKACKRTRVDLSCGCEWLRMRKTESLQVAIHEAKGYEIRWRKLGNP